MTIKRRDFIRYSSLGVAGGLLAVSPAHALGSGMPGMLDADTAGAAPGEKRTRRGIDDWEAIRASFPIDRSYVHMAGLFLTSHPEPVAEAIRENREALDRNPVIELQSRWGEAGAVRAVAGEYMGADGSDVGLTGSTTMGLGILIHGVRLSPGDEILQTTHDHSVTNRAIAYKAEHSGAATRRIDLYDNEHPEAVNEAEVLDRLRAALRPDTRVFVATWVHSRNGVKLPLASMARVLEEANRDRSPDKRVLFVVDGVHGFGIEDVAIPDLGCDFFSAGTHKWIFGPRGTGVVWGRPEVQDRVSPVIPVIAGGGGWGGSMSPGGFTAFEHRWALARAFEFHMEIGKSAIHDRIHELNSALKEGMRHMPHVRLYTPSDPAYSSGLVCFDVEGRSPRETVATLLEEHRIIGSTTPYSPSFARLTPGLLTDEADVEACLEALHGMG